MKLKIFATHSRGFRVVKAVAVIPESKTNGIKRRQKTFTVRTVAPQFAVSELQKTFEAAAGRWEQKVLSRPHEEEHETEQELMV